MTIYSLSGLLTAITSGLMTGLMLFIGKNKLHYLWAVFCFSVFLFGLGIYFVGGASNPEDATFAWKLAHVGAIFIPVLFLHFVHEFLGIKKTWVLIFLYAVSIFLLATDFIDGLFIANMRFVFDQFYYDSPPGLFYPLFTTIFFGLTAYSHFLLWRGLRESNDIHIKAKIKFFFFGTFVGFAGGAFNFLPVYGIDIYPFMNITVFLYPLVITYAIIKHQLFNIKLILVELAILSLNLFLFINIFTSHTWFDYALNSSGFVIVIIFSAFLVKGMYKEIHNRERIEELVWEKAKANDHLRQMEIQKTEFVSIASHQLRAPVTVIKGYASLLLEGSFGPLSVPVQEVMKKLYASSSKLVSLIEDLLTVSRIEQKRTTMNFETVSLYDFTREVVDEMNPIAQESKIYLSFSAGEGEDSYISVDKQKLKQAVSRIIENAIKYTKGPGFVYITTSFDNIANKVRLVVSDTGVGMTAEQIDDIFKRFDSNLVVDEDEIVAEKEGVSRNRVHGIGLYIAQEIIEAHHGVLHIESIGVNGGTTVVIELPVASRSLSQEGKDASDK